MSAWGVIPRNHVYKEKYNDSLLEYDEGDMVNIKRVRDKTDLLVYLSSKHISIGDNIEIVSKDKTNKVMIINNDTTMTILSYDNAMNIFVEKLKNGHLFILNMMSRF